MPNYTSDIYTANAEEEERKKRDPNSNNSIC